MSFIEYTIATDAFVSLSRRRHWRGRRRGAA